MNLSKHIASPNRRWRDSFSTEMTYDDLASNYSSSHTNNLASKDGYVYHVYPFDTGDPLTVYNIRLIQRKPDGITATFDFDIGSSGLEEDVRASNNYKKTTDKAHASPAVGVDNHGRVWITGSMHLHSWSILRSDSPHDIGSFSVPTNLPAGHRITYCFFLTLPTGLLLFYRAWSSVITYWSSGSRNGYLARYNEESDEWDTIGGTGFYYENIDYEAESATLVGKRWTVSVLDTIQAAWNPLFASRGGAYLRYFRYPIGHVNQGNIIPGGGKIFQFGYQGYKLHPWVNAGRIYVAVVVYTPALWKGGTGTRTETVSGSNYTWSTEEFVANYDTGMAIMIAYTDDRGDTWHAPNGEEVSLPMSESVLTEANGGIVFQSANITEEGSLALEMEIFLLDGKPTVRYRHTPFDGSSTEYTRSWDGSSWSIQSAITGPVANTVDTLWNFVPDAPGSNRGQSIRYQLRGASWKEPIPSGFTSGDGKSFAFANGIRFDHGALQSGVIRYVQSDIQRVGGTKVVSVKASAYHPPDPEYLAGVDPDAVAFIKSVQAKDGAPPVGWEAATPFIDAFYTDLKSSTREVKIKALGLFCFGSAEANRVDMINGSLGQWFGPVTHPANAMLAAINGRFTFDRLMSEIILDPGNAYLCAGRAATSGSGPKHIVGANGSSALADTQRMSIRTSSWDLYRDMGGSTEGAGGGRIVVAGSANVAGIISGSNLGAMRGLWLRQSSGRTELAKDALGPPDSGTISVTPSGFNASGDPSYSSSRSGMYFACAGLGLTDAEDAAHTLALKALWEGCTGATLP